ncbi:hypothetical protein BO70DRAFT_301870 [Aspergillus heteromorphus CBS 117.55]|uniref:Uncharacterized protein n=1 Tax=Aspergillus heteromorphus CBS 117.55 TaxID=1448321 RepID=A0A317UZP4_9EURO|nr:uncharacterized protein BO70DRAFT_301870 [Aspergillus heteromorphus CBS 117.55]PWY66027.1 hypothetical protein BO70DRAFT_301870 [Aspergillus heteromorphus CBS 117.55]
MKLALVPVLFTTSTLGLSIARAQNTVPITFIGAGGAQFTQAFSTDGSFAQINNALSVSHISSGMAGVTCTFNGVDNGVTTITGPGEVDVGPPQTQVQGACSQGSTPPSHPVQPKPSGGQVLITFVGAANAQFSQEFPTNGAETTITNPLSISHIMSNTGGVQCTFNGIDHSVTNVNGAETVDVGPPQTQVSGACHA